MIIDTFPQLSYLYNHDFERTNTAKSLLIGLNKLKDEGRLILAGPHPAIDNNEPGEAGFTGSLVVAEFEDLKDARDWADADPYVAAGVYSSVVVKTFKKVLP